MTIAAMASTIGTARGTTQGSCRPRAASTPFEPSYVAVGCSLDIVAGDLKAHLSDGHASEHRCWRSAKWRDDGPEVDVFAVADATLYPSTPIRRGPQSTFLLPHKHVVMPAPRDLRPSEPGPDLEAFGSRNGEHRVRQEGFEFVEGWLAETRRAVADDAGDGAADAVGGFFRPDDALWAPQIDGISDEILGET